MIDATVYKMVIKFKLIRDPSTNQLTGQIESQEVVITPDDAETIALGVSVELSKGLETVVQLVPEIKSVSWIFWTEFSGYAEFRLKEPLTSRTNTIYSFQIPFSSRLLAPADIQDMVDTVRKMIKDWRSD